MRVASSGNQFDRKKRFNKFAKLTAQSSNERIHKPPRNRSMTDAFGATSATWGALVLGRTNPGASRCSQYSIRPRSAPRMSNRCTDSGSSRTSRIATPSGRSPPTIKTERQPVRGINTAASSPPRIAPAVNPQEMPMSNEARRALGQYSLARVIALPNTPPSPSPVKNRRANI